MRTDSRVTRRIISRQDVGVTASVLQKNDLLLHTFVTDVPALILLRRGKKTLKAGGKKIVLHPGDAVAIQAGTTCDVLNETERGQFESTWIVCPNETIARVRRDFPKTPTLNGVVGLKGLGPSFVSMFERAVEAITLPKSVSKAVAEHRVREVLVWLAQEGAVFSAEELTDLKTKVRLMIGAAPEKDWQSKDVASAFAMSEATFRRRLADKQQSFKDILIDVRMTAALTLLQVTDKSIADVAYQVGYDSASRFSVRFKKRFGFSPNAVRGVPAQLDA